MNVHSYTLNLVNEMIILGLDNMYVMMRAGLSFKPLLKQQEHLLVGKVLPIHNFLILKRERSGS